MADPPPTRYEQVSRRALLKASLGAGALASLGIACGTSDAEVFADAAAQPVATTLAPTPFPTEAATDSPDTDPPPSTATDTTPTEQPAATAEPVSTNAVDGEMIIAFAYTQAAGGKNERPYIAVWIEDAAGELAQTVSLWFQQDRRGDRWLDHLSRWFPANSEFVSQGGVDDTATISSATREAGSYAVAWDGFLAGNAAPAGNYFVCIEAVREDGPYSLIREPLSLAGGLGEVSLPAAGELSAATVRIDAPV